MFGARYYVKYGPNLTSFCPFQNKISNIVQYLTLNEKSIDDVLGNRSWDHRMVGIDKSTELSRPTKPDSLLKEQFDFKPHQMAVLGAPMPWPLIQAN